MVNLLHDVPIGEDAPEEVNVLIEIPKGSRVKYEFDRDIGAIVVDRILYSSVVYPYNYGEIVQTYYDDDDPLDVIVIGFEPLAVGTIIKVRPIGMVVMEDEKGQDDKILAVPVKDPRFKDWKDVSDVPEHILKEIAEFFETYKRLEPGKWVKVKEWKGAEEAKKAIRRAMDMYKEKFGGK